jgi:ClpP class serine protease
MKEAFVDSVMRRRSQSPYKPIQIDADTLAEGHVYLGREALAIGLVDALGGRSDAILGAAELAGVEKYQVVELTDYMGLHFEPIYDAWALVGEAMPGTAFLLDSRIPLTSGTPEGWAGDSFSTILPSNPKGGSR